MALKFPIHRHPGDGYNYIRCMICDRKIFAKDSIYISDKYNLLYGMTVCKRDAEKTNPQNIPYYPRPEEPPIRVTGDSPTNPVINPLDSRAPSAPTNGLAQGNQLGPGVWLYWTAPQDSGTSGIIGYKITRAEPQFSTQFLLIDNTNSFATQWLDETANINSEYSYQVAAINSFGIGPYSELFFFPGIIEDLTNVDYLVTSDTLFVIETGDGKYIIR